ncbi:MAG: YraN family protein, partial [Candidatus Cloacimonetes bacterium]|nr:YraN family protein [Candidatus Cloacimonadota bacterium]
MGENLAAKYLERQGYRLVCRNYRCRQGEIDLIVEKDQQL